VSPELITRTGAEYELIREAPEQTLPRLDSRFSESAVHPDLLGLQLIIKGLMRFLPSDRLTACEALELLPEYEYSEDSEDDEDSEDGQEL
jgi:hypothetical protein